jgi:hypothetical protein
MIRDHKFFEMQSALAATGQLSDTELTELEKHADDCASCRECMADMAEMSREFFLTQARRVSSKEMPAAIQERFLERAANAGIPVSCPASTILDLRFARVAIIMVVLSIFVSLSWKVFYVSHLERAAIQNSSAPGIPNGQALEEASEVARGHAVRNMSASRSQFSRRPRARHRTVSISSTPDISEDRQSYLDLRNPLFIRQGSTASFSDRRTFWSERMAESYLIGEMYTPTSSSFTKAGVASFFGRKENGKPEEQSFHYDLRLASLSFLESPQGADLEPRITSLKFSAPVFHLDANRAW